MPLFLAIVGILLIVTSVRNTQSELLTQLADDGKHFVPWAMIIIVVGVLGLFKTWRGISNLFLALIVIAMLLGKNQSANNIIAGFNSIINESKT